ncbi:MAG: hypothetical protein LBG80_04805 [Bacteroidales bacterium]|nr:hypothetical protein [Bacteroidales bacterium]
MGYIGLPTIAVAASSVLGLGFDGLGIPVITNKEVLNSAFIEKMKIGYVINYKYDSSWHFLALPDYIETVKPIGKNDRDLYLQNYTFPKLVEKRLLPILAE